MEDKQSLSDIKIVKILMGRPPMSASDIIKKSKVSKATVHRRLKLLESHKLVKRFGTKYVFIDYFPLEEQIGKALKEVLERAYSYKEKEEFDDLVRKGQIFHLSESHLKEIAVNVGKAPDDSEFLKVFSEVLKKHDKAVKLAFSSNIRL